MRGYTEARATGAGAGAREVLDAVVRDYEARGDRSAMVVGNVARVYDRSAYLEFTTYEGDHLGPAMVLLGGPEFDGPLATRIEPSADSRWRGEEGVPFRELPVTVGDRCRIRTRARVGSGRTDGFALSVGDSFDVLLDREDCRPVEEQIPQYREAGSIDRDSDVWERAREILRWLDERDVEDGLGWRSDLLRIVEGEPRNDELQTLADGWADVMTGVERRELDQWFGGDGTEEVDRPVSGWLDVLGRGPGATPSGDDLVSGILLTLFRTTGGRRRERVSRVGERVVARAEGRTTDVSTALLAQAGRGRTSGRVEAGLRALLDPAASRRRPREALSDVLRMGHTSGADTVLGALLAVLLVCPTVSRSLEFQQSFGGRR